MTRVYRAFRDLATRLAAIGSLALLAAASSAAPAFAQTEPTVFLVPDGGTGVILTDPQGWTLYTWVGDRPGTSNCFDACTDAWPPYLVEDEILAPIGMPGQLGWLDRGDGTVQVTIDGWPIYYFTGDGRPGDTKGDEIVAFGASWQVAAYPPRTPTSGQTPGVPVRVADGPSPSFGSPPPPPGVEPSIIPITSPFNPNSRPSAPAPSGQPNQGPGVIVVDANYAQTLTVLAPPSGIVGLNWVPISSAVSYRIYQASSGAPSTFELSQTVNQPTGQQVTTGNITNLVPGQTYYLQVRAADARGIETTTMSAPQFLGR